MELLAGQVHFQPYDVRAVTKATAERCNVMGMILQKMSLLK